MFFFQLMRVYGALLWSLGKVLNTPEVMRVYIGYDHPHTSLATLHLANNRSQVLYYDALVSLKKILNKLPLLVHSMTSRSGRQLLAHWARSCSRKNRMICSRT
jgi:hypothetical protein